MIQYSLWEWDPTLAVVKDEGRAECGTCRALRAVFQHETLQIVQWKKWKAKEKQKVTARGFFSVFNQTDPGVFKLEALRDTGKITPLPSTWLSWFGDECWWPCSALTGMNHVCAHVMLQETGKEGKVPSIDGPNSSFLFKNKRGTCCRSPLFGHFILSKRNTMQCLFKGHCVSHYSWIARVKEISCFSGLVRGRGSVHLSVASCLVSGCVENLKIIQLFAQNICQAGFPQADVHSHGIALTVQGPTQGEMGTSDGCRASGYQLPTPPSPMHCFQGWVSLFPRPWLPNYCLSPDVGGWRWVWSLAKASNGSPSCGAWCWPRTSRAPRGTKQVG